MDPATALGSAFAAFGLSGAAGLNAWIPLLAIGVADRLGVVDLGDPYDALASTPALIALAVAFAVDFVGDKIPAVDHLLHAVGMAIHPVAGAALFAAQTGVAGDLDPGVALVAGAIIAGSVHAGRASLRPASTATTGGMGNPVLSLIEDVASLAVVGARLPGPGARLRAGRRRARGDRALGTRAVAPPARPARAPAAAVGVAAGSNCVGPPRRATARELR